MVPVSRLLLPIIITTTTSNNTTATATTSTRRQTYPSPLLPFLYLPVRFGLLPSRDSPLPRLLLEAPRGWKIQKGKKWRSEKKYLRNEVVTMLAILLVVILAVLVLVGVRVVAEVVEPLLYSQFSRS